MSDTIVVVGAGHSAGYLVAGLRSGGNEGRIVLIGEEPYLPYQRPPLSKQFLSGEIDRDRLFIQPANFYQDADVEVRTATRAVAVERSAQLVHLDTGEPVGYDQLVLATGSRPRQLHVPGAGLEGVYDLRGMDDALVLRDHFRQRQQLVIIGGGYIGLEAAAVASKLGLDVTVLEMMPRLMNRVVSDTVSAFYLEQHRACGVMVHTDTRVHAIEGDTRASGVTCTNGAFFAADLILVAVGVVPNTGLAEDAGLKVNDGIVVDERGMTSDPAIFACGDCTCHPSALAGENVRLESVQNASAQARVVAANLCGEPAVYQETPTFWSDQYDLKLQIVGLARPDDEKVLRGDPGARSFAVYRLREDRVVAAEAINSPSDFVAALQLVSKQLHVVTAELGDSNLPIKQILKQASDRQEG